MSSSTRLRDRKELPALALDEAAVVNYGREVLPDPSRQPRGVSSRRWSSSGARASSSWAWSWGNYSLLALLINSFDTDLPPDRTEPLLPV